MNADHAFFIGNTHTVCEDYAHSGIVNNGAYAIVCDGCSQSPDVDFGARALALSAKRTLSLGGTDMQPDIFGKITIDNLAHIGDNFPLHPHSLDATLLVSWVKGQDFGVNMFGDGVFFHKTSTTLRIVHVEYESNTPAYLSYYLDKLRLKNYEDTVVGEKHVSDTTYYIVEGELGDAVESEIYMKPFEPLSFRGLVGPGDIIGVVSDGVNSFRRGDTSNIHWQDSLYTMTDFKSMAGVFVQRRLGFLKRQWLKEQTTHYDDISMAAITI